MPARVGGMPDQAGEMQQNATVPGGGEKGFGVCFHDAVFHFVASNTEENGGPVLPLRKKPYSP